MGFLNYLINGVSLGSVYAIIALGYTMVYGIAKMLNFAHGDVIMIGSYLVFVGVSTMGLPTIVSVLISVLACTLLGVTIERIAYKPLRGASPLAVLITAIGVSYLLQNIALLIFRCGYQVLYLRSNDSRCKAGRGRDDHYRRNHCDDSLLYYYHGRSHCLY